MVVTMSWIKFITSGFLIFFIFSQNLFAFTNNNRNSINEIIVTAEKHEEKLQNVPAAVTALTELDIDDAAIRNVDDVVKMIPNMTFNTTYISGFNEVNFRGLRLSQFTEKNPVVIFIDNIPQDSLSHYGTNLLNIERIEVLRGSQGTIYGKNAIGGVINIISKKPDNNLESKIYAEAGENNRFITKAYINGPMIKDKLFFSFSGGINRTDGYMKNTHPDGGYYNNENDLNLNTRIRFIPNKKSEINFHTNLTRKRYGSVVSINGSDNKIDYHAYKNPDDLTDIDNISTAVNYSYKGNLYDLTSITAYSYDEIEVSQDQCYMNPQKMLPVSVRASGSSLITQELRIQSPETKKDGVKWLGGLFLSRETLNYDKYAKEYKTSKMLGYRTLYNWSDDNRDYTKALFGQLIVPLPAGFQFTGGLRYENSEKEMDYKYEILRKDSNQLLPFDPFRPGKPSSVEYETSDSWDALLPKGVLSWKKNNFMVYGSIGKGYLAGGFNWCEHVENLAKFNEQTSLNYELGLKTAWLNNRLIFNANFFYMDIQDMHVYTAPDPLTYLTSNAGEAHSQGIEVELRAKPFQGFDIIGSAGYVNAEYDEYMSPAGADCSGKKLEGTPEYSFNLAAQYRTKSGLFSRLDIQGYGEYFFNEQNTIKQKAYEILNSKIGYESGNFDIYLYCRNIMDKEYFSFGRVNSQGVIANVGEPRTFGVTASIRF